MGLTITFNACHALLTVYAAKLDSVKVASKIIILLMGNAKFVVKLILMNIQCALNARMDLDINQINAILATIIVYVCGHLGVILAR